MGTKERRQREREQMRANILDAAIELFHEYGFEKTTIRRIAEKIEYTPGNIYAYFKNKNDILYAVHRRGFERLCRMEMAVIDTLDPAERLVKLGQVYIQFALKHPAYYDLMFIKSHVQQVIAEGEEWQEGQNAYGILRNTVADCIQKGALPQGDIDSAAFAIWSFVHGLVSLHLRGRCAMIPQEHLPVVMRSAYAYLQSALTNRRDIHAMLRSDAFEISP